MPFIKGQDPVIEQIGCHQGILPVIDLGKPMVMKLSFELESPVEKRYKY